MQIKEMTAADLEQVGILAAQLGYPEPLERLSARFKEANKIPMLKLYVAKDAENNVLGWIQINRESHTILSDPRAEISALVVDERHRGKGIGASLMAKAELWAEENRLSLIRVRSNVKRSEAHRFYQKMGYTIKKSWHLFTKEI